LGGWEDLKMGRWEDSENGAAVDLEHFGEAERLKLGIFA
jgi:hypothetical protein